MQIKEVHISNFRSLRDVTVQGLIAGVVLHGANNSGKSNILLALETIFSAKAEGPGVSLSQDVSEGAPPIRATPFWNGYIFDFADNFYMGTNQDIAFSVRIEVPAAHFQTLVDANLIVPLLRVGHDYQVKIAGRIARSESDGEMILETVHLNNKVIFGRHGENVEWLPWLGTKVEPTRKQLLGESILDSFTNSVYVIPADRYLTANEEEAGAPSLKSSSYKSWLHNESLSRPGFETFKVVQSQLKDSPFRYGEISFAKEGTRIDIMVDDGCGFRMPIAQKGTGVQQILVLLGYIAASRAHVIGIEEPEVNLSFKSQDDLVTSLLKLLPVE